MAIYRKKKFTSPKKVGGPEIGAAHKSQKVGGPRAARPSRLRRQCSWWCMKLWGVTSLGSVQVVGLFDVAARLCAGDGPIAALVGGSSCSIGFSLQHRTFNDYKNDITV